MKNFKNYIIKKLFGLIIVLGLGAMSVNSQTINGEDTLNRSLEQLKNKYSWHSIYLSYSSILQIRTVLSIQAKYQGIAQQHSSQVVSILLIKLNDSLDSGGINKSAGIIEIDLNRVDIGLVKANSISGEIESFKLDYWWKIRIAMICDGVLSGIYRVQNYNKQMSNNEIASVISIEDAVNTYQTFYNDPYISTESANLALFGLRTLIENKPQEFEKLNQTNKELYANLSNFKTSFDNALPKSEVDKFKGNKRFSDEYLQALSEASDSQKSNLRNSLEKSSAYLAPTNQKSNPYINKQRIAAGIIATNQNDETFRYSQRDYELGEYLSGDQYIIGLGTRILAGKAGEKIIAEDYILTVISVEKTKQISPAINASEGKAFLSVEMIIESKNKTGIDINSSYTRVKDSKDYEYNSSLNGKEPTLKSQTNLPLGEKVRGWVTFEIPEDAKDFTLIYQTLIPTRTRISIVLGK